MQSRGWYTPMVGIWNLSPAKHGAKDWKKKYPLNNILKKREGFWWSEKK